MLRCVVTKRKCTFHQKDQGPQIQSYGNNNLNHDSSVLRMQSYIALVPNYCARLGIWKKLFYPESIEHNEELAQEFESTKLHKQFTPTPVRFLMSCGILK